MSGLPARDGPPAVVIPARDEAGTVGAVVRAAREALPSATVIVVDDASGDGTGEEARAAGADVVRLDRHAGYAGALRAGFRAAADAGLGPVAQLDADGQHDPADLPRLLAALAGADLVVGSRFLTPGGYRPPLVRVAAIAACRAMAGRVGGITVTDPTSGFRALRPRLARLLAEEGFPFGLTETSLLIALHRRGFRIAEAPVHMRPCPGASMHAGLAGGAHFLRISIAVLALAAGRGSR